MRRDKVLRGWRPDQEVEGEKHRRRIERPAAEENVERAALEGAEPSAVGDLLPKELETRSRTVCSSFCVAVDKNRCVHSARGRT